MDKKIRNIVIVMFTLTLLDILVSVIWLEFMPLFSIFINFSLIGLIVKYAKQKKHSSPITNDSTIVDSDNDRIDVKRLAAFLIIPFVSLAVVLTYVFYLFLTR